MEWLNEILLPEEAKRAFKEAQECIDNKNYDLALLKLQLAITYKSNFPDFHALQGLCFYNKAMYSSSIYSLKKALELNNEHKQSYYYLGLVQAAMKEYTPAIENYRKAIQFGYQEAPVYNFLGLAYFNKNEMEKALTQYNIAVSKDPTYYKAYKNIAQIYYSLGKYPEAIDYCKKALLINTGYTDAYYCLGECYLKTGNNKASINSLSTALKSEPNNNSLYSLLAKAHIYDKNYDEAIYYLSCSLKFNPDNIEILQNLGNTYLNAGYTDNAIAIYNKLLKLSSPSSNLFFALGKCYQLDPAMQNVEEAINYFKKALNLEPENYKTLYHLGTSYLINKETEVALEYFEKMLKFETNNKWSSEIYKNLGKAYLEAGLYNKAVEYLKKSIQELHSETTEPDGFDELNGLLDKAYELIDKSLVNNAGEEKLNNKSASNSTPIYRLLNRLYNHLRSHKQFEALSSKVNELILAFDKPLILTVMGEFKVGKSTFINALVGKEIAPMGITPTTATINYFQYGSRNKIRINWLDGSEPDSVRIDRLAEYVDERKVNKQEVENIKLVEIFYDWELLRDINVVDTPGLNAGITRHEETTINFIEQADAIIWLFDVEQAGKASEKKIFEYIRKFSKKTVAVVNGADKVDSDELSEVIDYLKQEFSDYFSDIIPVSSRNALRAKLNNDESLLEKSFFTELENFLNINIYSKSYQIKNESILTKLVSIINEAKLITENYKNIHSRRLESVKLFRNKIESTKKLFSLHIQEEELHLRTGFQEIYNEAGKEAKEFINPTRRFFERVFGTNKFNNEDKTFLLKLIQDRTSALLNQTQTSLEKKVRQFNDDFREILENLSKLSFELADNNYLSLMEVYNKEKLKELYSNVILSNYRYYQGYLDAGVLDKFFNEIGYSTDLSVTNLTEQISKSLPDILPSVKECLNFWSDEHFNFLINLSDTIEKDTKNVYINIYQDIIRPLERLSPESFTNLITFV